MIRSSQNKIFVMLVCLLLAACSGTRNLPKGDKLYTGAEINLESAEKINKKFIKTVAEAGVRPAPNKKILGMRPKLWMYNTAGEDPKTKINKWLKKTGEAPVLMRDVKPGITCEIIDARLFNIGIFKSFTESKIVEKKRTFKVIYTSHVHKPFVVKELTYAISDDSISRLIIADKDKSVIKPGEDYNLDKLRIERIRIDALLKNNGYFYFNPDHLLFKADTSNVNRNVSFKLTLKDSIPQNALTVYRINAVYINQNYSLNERRTNTSKDTVRFENVVFVGKETQMKIKPKVILESIYLHEHEIFSRQNHVITLNRLMSMGNFKLVQVIFSETNTKTTGLLDVNILLTPLPKHTFRAGLDLVSKSNNFMGPRMNLSLLNRNTFKGAELLNLNLAGSFEAQLSGNTRNLFSYSWNPQVELTYPRFLLPFNLKKTGSIYIPKTHFLLSYNYLKRVSYFDMRTFQFVFGYKWKENIRKEHELNPIDVSYTTVGNKSTAFNDLVDPNPFLKKSYEEKFIAGGSYSFTYNEQVIPGKKVQSYIHLNSEIAGNLFSLVKVISGSKVSAENPATISGSVFSQFAKVSIDYRGYYNFKDKNKLAIRLFAGVAKPYGNSSVLPYTKQFFSGGPNSIRAFHINSVGPGTYLQNVDSLGFLQLGGDLKLEMNAEYRFGIMRYLKGALFVDAGNVWLLKANPENIGTPFMFSKFLDEVAVGTGVGLRIDVSFFILRFDLAMPLRKIPKSGDNFRWVTNEINFGSSVWRKDNLILNVAIGYPF
ncbi:MAG: BamA/TamA family outer membrane protein [Bacteroidia bacterium]|nr:BamA/TamA family outer membrane protein [Bacteroidia bacterium]